MSERKCKSSWCRGKKTRFTYSQIYLQWQAAAKKDGARSKVAVDLACRHARMMAVDAEICHDGYREETPAAFELASVS